MPQTLYDKIWNEHIVHQQDDGTTLLYVDRHLIHEVTSPQAFEGLRLSKRKVRKPNLALAVADHNVPTTSRSKGIDDMESKIQVEMLEKNCKEFGIKLFDMKDKRQGIVHIIGPEQGFTQPGTVIVCGDSHTATHGAFGALAFGIGTSEVEHVLATQTLIQKKYTKIMNEVLEKVPNLPEWHNKETINKFNKVTWKESIIQLHQPKSAKVNKNYLDRLIYDEIFATLVTNSKIRLNIKKIKKKKKLLKCLINCNLLIFQII